MSDLALLARVAGQRVAFQADDIESVIDLADIVPVPLAPAHIAGLAAARSKVMTVVDTAAAVMLNQDAATRRRALVVVRDGHRYALTVDAVEDVTRWDRADASVSQSVGEHWQKVSKAVVANAEGFAILVDIDALIAGPRTAINAALTSSH